MARMHKRGVFSVTKVGDAVDDNGDAAVYQFTSYNKEHKERRINAPSPGET